MIDLDMLKLQAVKTGLGLKYLAKEERISILLKQLKNMFSDEIVILKGGTAFNRCYLYETHKARFSEDIDLDYFKAVSLDEKIKDIKKKMRKIKEFTISAPRLLHRTVRFDCKYASQLGEGDRVQVEFYLSEKISASPPQNLVVQSQYLPVEATMFSVYSLEDLIAQKLVSYYRRTEGKDIYDLFYGLDLSFHKKTVYTALNHLFDHYHIRSDHHQFFEKILEKTDDMQENSRFIGNSTNHFIPIRLRPNWNIFIKGLKEKIRDHFT